VAESVNKAELVDRLAARLDVTKKLAGEAVEAIVDEITKAVAKGDKVEAKVWIPFQLVTPANMDQFTSKN